MQDVKGVNGPSKQISEVGTSEAVRRLRRVTGAVLSDLMLHPLEDKAREELDKLLHADDVISMRLLCIKFDSELLFAAACSAWLHSVTRLEYVVDPTLFPH